MDLSRRRSNPVFPTNRLASRGMMRDLAQLISLGEDISNVSSEKFTTSYETYLINNCIDYNSENLGLPRNTFKRWVDGDSFPQNKRLTTFFTPVSDIRNRWEIRKNFTCRLQRYLACLDLEWMAYEKKEVKQAKKLAKRVLKNIHKDWRFDSSLDIAIKGPANEKPYSNPYASLLNRTTFFEEEYSKIQFSLELKQKGYIYPRIDFQGITFYRLEEKTSVIPHLFWLAMHLKPNGANVHSALIFDLLTAVIAAKHLNYYRVEENFMLLPHKVTMSELIGDFCIIFFTADFYELQDDDYQPESFGENPPSESLKYEFDEIFKIKLEKNTEVKIKEDAFENLFNLKVIFFETLSRKTGLAKHEVLNEIKETQAYFDSKPYKIKFGGEEFLDE